MLGRLYGIQGCPHCEMALAYFAGAQVPIQAISTENDPVIAEGLKKLQNREDVQVPTLVVFGTKEVIVGSNFEQYQRAVADYRARLSAGGSDIPLAQGGDSPAPTPIAVEVEVAPEAPAVS